MAEFPDTRTCPLIRSITALLMMALLAGPGVSPLEAARKQKDPKVIRALNKALEYLKREQRRQGYWEARGGQYRVAMTALAANALLAEGSTTTTGKHRDEVAQAVDFLVGQSRSSGLIGYKSDYRYTYGHGFSMLFLSQVYGEEEDKKRRADLKKVLVKAVDFSAKAQTTRGGWGYVSAKDGNDFDEGSTCITQVQGLRACRNAGIPVPKEIIDRAQKYIRDCMTPDGGIRYRFGQSGGARPPITAAAVACMFNSGEYKTDQVTKMMTYCEKHVWPGRGVSSSFGHWHYTHYYFSQVMYRMGEEKWSKYYGEIKKQLLRTQSSSGAWLEGYIGPVYTTSINATILQLENGFLPIYQR
jgi:hypothetical protein|tara:strand:- start:5 stop:1075 length:1071 start_codon:yes stop_codon:yes gene_type:complete